MKKFSFYFLFICFGLCSDLWVAKSGPFTWYESDFYAFFPKDQWSPLDDVDKKTKIMDSFLKQNVAAERAVALGLEYTPDINKKLFSRFNMLMVNEYYMHHFLEKHIPRSATYFCSQNLKKDVYVKHILLKEGSPPSVSLNKALDIKNLILQGENFSSLAIESSVDPSVSQNQGVLGWISVGSTVPAFQDAIFDLCLGCVDIVKTDFGYHVVMVDSVRDSRYSFLSKEEYDDYVFRFSSAYIEGSLKDLASEHDSLLLASKGVVFDLEALESLTKNLDVVLKSKKGNRQDVDLINVLNNNPGVVVLYDENYLSSSWFANKIERSLHRASFYSNVEDIKKDFEIMLLRDIVYNEGLSLGLNNNYSFNKQFVPVRLGVLEKAYLNFLVEGVVVPSKKEVEKYYLESGQSGSLSVAYKSIETILLQKAQEGVKDVFFNSVVERKNIDVNKGWFND